MCLDNLTPVQQNEWPEMNARWAEAEAGSASRWATSVSAYAAATRAWLVAVHRPSHRRRRSTVTWAVADAGRYLPQVPQTDGDRSFTNALRTFTLNQSCVVVGHAGEDLGLSNAPGTDEVEGAWPMSPRSARTSRRGSRRATR